MWEDSVKARKDVKPAEKKRMLLSTETLEGLRMTGELFVQGVTHTHHTNRIPSILLSVYSFTEMAEYLLSLKGVKFLLSEKFNQDPLESYFSKQRSRGARSDNPSIQQCLQNARAIRASKTLTLGNCSNIRKRKADHDVKQLSAPPTQTTTITPCQLLSTVNYSIQHSLSLIHI